MGQGIRATGAVMAAAAAIVLAIAGCSAAHTASAGRAAAGARSVSGPFLERFRDVSQIASTVPGNGDVNPYGVAVVPASAGRLVRGDVLVSNFNDKANLQGTGTTIVQVAPDGAAAEFARLTTLPRSMRCPGGIGLTTALAVLPGGWVVVGSLPTTRHGTLPAANPLGCLIVLNSQGKPTETWVSQDIDGPWDLTVADTAGHADLLVTNVLSRPAGMRGRPAPAGVCTVIRAAVTVAAGRPPRLTGVTVIGSGFPWAQNKAALIQGPTGAALGRDGTLYVASTLGNSITAIPAALTRTTAVTAGTHVLTSGHWLAGPLGLARAPSGDLVAVNGGNGDAVEITPAGRQIAAVTLVRRGAGDLFGLAPEPGGRGMYFVNDGTNALDLLSG